MARNKYIAGSIAERDLLAVEEGWQGYRDRGFRGKGGAGIKHYWCSLAIFSVWWGEFCNRLIVHTSCKLSVRSIYEALVYVSVCLFRCCVCCCSLGRWVLSIRTLLYQPSPLTSLTLISFKSHSLWLFSLKTSFPLTLFSPTLHSLRLSLLLTYYPLLWLSFSITLIPSFPVTDSLCFLVVLTLIPPRLWF